MNVMANEGEVMMYCDNDEGNNSCYGWGDSHVDMKSLMYFMYQYSS